MQGPSASCRPRRRAAELTLQVDFQPHALGLSVMLNDVVHFGHIAANARLPAKVLIKELGEVTLQLEAQLALFVHGCRLALPAGRKAHTLLCKFKFCKRPGVRGGWFWDVKLMESCRQLDQCRRRPESPCRPTFHHVRAALCRSTAVQQP